MVGGKVAVMTGISRVAVEVGEGEGVGDKVLTSGGGRIGVSSGGGVVWGFTTPPLLYYDKRKHERKYSKADMRRVTSNHKLTPVLASIIRRAVDTNISVTRIVNLSSDWFCGRFMERVGLR
jgi:hypothetical protein